jgi:hypothetical protein
MKAKAIKKILRIEGDDPDEDIIRVFLEVPEFQNFGQRLGELGRKAWEAEFDDPPDKDQFKYDLQRLRVDLPMGMNWNKDLEARVDQFLMGWPRIRSAVLEAVFEYYKKVQPPARRIHNTAGSAFTLPAPTAPEVVADLFRVSVICLQDDEASIGIAGGCTWDLEHLWGVRIEHDKVVDVGGLDVASNC